MGNNFNKVLYSILGIIFLALILLKFFFKRSIPISKLPINERKEHQLFKRKTIPINVINKKQVLSNQIIKLKKRTIQKTSRKVDFINKGREYSFTGNSNNGNLIVEDHNTGNLSSFTGSIMVKMKSNQNLKDILKKYNLKLVKDFSSRGYYYLSGVNAQAVKEQLSVMYNDKSFSSLEPEILGRPVKIR